MPARRTTAIVVTAAVAVIGAVVALPSLLADRDGAPQSLGSETPQVDPFPTASLDDEPGDTAGVFSRDREMLDEVAPEVLAEDKVSDLVPEDLEWLRRADEVGEAVVLDELQEIVDANSDPRLSNYCHQLAHELGRQAYARHSDILKALEASTLWCGGGYTHGVFEGWGRQVTLDEIITYAPTICGSGQSSSPVDSLCAHGYGHALMQTNPGREEAFAVCETMAQPHVWECIEGVMMLYSQAFLRPCGTSEQIASGECSDELLEASDDPFYGFDLNEYCAMAPDAVQARCHFSAGFSWLGVITSNRPIALGLCAKMDGHPDAPARCAWGVGTSVPDEAGLDTHAGAVLCETAPEGLVEPCMLGLFEVSMHHAGLAGIDDYCGTLPGEWVELCRGGTQHHRTALGG